MMSDYEHLLACYRSGQISERQWQEHLRDKDFRDWAQKRREGPMPDRVIMVRESEWREMREALESAHKYVVASDHPASDRDLKHIEAVLAHPTPDGCGREGGDDE